MVPLRSRRARRSASYSLADAFVSIKLGMDKGGNSGSDDFGLIGPKHRFAKV
jgi:hypothetical protein